MDEEFPGLKLLLSYEVQPKTIQDYRQFVLQQYIPEMQNMGFQISEAWHTAYGDAPNRLIGFVCRDRETLDDLLLGEVWLDLNDRLERYVTEFSYKVVPYRGIFQI
ncbi:MAG: hypothetical protein GY796_19935 [Chloroflexi bacterium]|nr:hypothetical protein [Chloroflexota bacterium]